MVTHPSTNRARRRSTSLIETNDATTAPLTVYMLYRCGYAGTITLLDGDKILWSLFVDHQLFALSKLDVTVRSLVVTNLQ